jgi:hypothetical protein
MHMADMVFIAETKFIIRNLSGTKPFQVQGAITDYKYALSRNMLSVYHELKTKALVVCGDFVSGRWDLIRASRVYLRSSQMVGKGDTSIIVAAHILHCSMSKATPFLDLILSPF